MINELKLYDFQGIIPLPNENIDHYSKRAQKTQKLMKEFYDFIKSSVETHNYHKIPVSLSKNPKVEFWEPISIPRYGFDNPLFPIITLREDSFFKNASSDDHGICLKVKYKGTKLPLIVILNYWIDHTGLIKHEEFHGIRIPFRKGRLQPGSFSNEYYEEYIGALIYHLGEKLSIKKDFTQILKDAEDNVSSRRLKERKLLRLCIPIEILGTIISLYFFRPLGIVLSNTLLGTCYYLGCEEYAMRKLKKFSHSIENIQASTDRPILPLLARISHNEFIDISNKISDGKYLDRIIEERMKGKYGYRWEIIHDRL